MKSLHLQLFSDQEGERARDWPPGGWLAAKENRRASFVEEAFTPPSRPSIPHPATCWGSTLRVRMETGRAPGCQSSSLHGWPWLELWLLASCTRGATPCPWACELLDTHWVPRELYVQGVGLGWCCASGPHTSGQLWANSWAFMIWALSVEQLGVAPRIAVYGGHYVRSC